MPTASPVSFRCRARSIPTVTGHRQDTPWRGYTARMRRDCFAHLVLAVVVSATAFLSTVLDLATWEARLRTDTILSDAIRRQMWSRVQLGDRTHPYGFGWHVATLGGRPVVWHGGGLPGFSAQFLRFLDDGVTVIVLAKGDQLDLAGIAARIALFYLPEPSAASPQEPPAPPGSR
jgi:hypothetical protein